MASSSSSLPMNSSPSRGKKRKAGGSRTETVRLSTEDADRIVEAFKQTHPGEAVPKRIFITKRVYVRRESIFSKIFGAVKRKIWGT
ncbi:hypothetical protein HDV00_001063 [Rhizophlyctis rosea]|nr:hypothetical protein HDV00_001063 [Rhizophlyctis rosea]